MRTRISALVGALWMAAMPAAFAASSVERIKNEKVVVISRKAVLVFDGLRATPLNGGRNMLRG